MTPSQLLVIKPGITIGNVITLFAYLVSMVAFGVYLRADIDQQSKLIIRNAEVLHEHLETTQKISDKQINVLARLQITENNLQTAREMGERLKGIETSLDFIVDSIKELKADAKGKKP